MVKANEERSAIMNDVVGVLDGAEDARTKLDALLSLGNPSPRKMAYAVKMRVKSQHSAVEKILSHRRAGEVEYSAAHLRDLVGVRIVTLYDADKPEALRLLLQLIQASSREAFGLFRPDPIEEIKIYHVPAAGSEQSLEVVLATLTAFGYTQNAESKPPVQIEQKNSRYSSIHIVAWCLGHGSKGARHIPVEFQIRNAFEDVWGEIDHSLKYKTDNKELPDRLVELRSVCMSMIATLKDSMQVASSNADQIRSFLNRLSGEEIISLSPGPSLNETQQFAARHSLPTELRTLISEALRLQERAFGLEAAAHGAVGRDIFRTAMLEALAAWEAALAYVVPEFPQRGDLLYHLKMEEALCNFYLGRRGLSANPEVSATDGAKTHLVSALRVYREMVERFPQRAIVHFRLAQVLAKFKELDSAIEAGRTALSCLKDDKTVPKRNWLRVRTPRMLSYFLWESADDIRRRGEEMGFPTLHEATRLSRYLEAIDVARLGQDLEIDDFTIGSSKWTKSMERCLTVNNIISYALDYLGAGGDPAELASRQLTAEQIDKLAGELEFDTRMPLRAKLDILDTQRALALARADVERAKTYANEVLRYVQEKGVEPDAFDSHLTDIIGDAHRTAVDGVA